MRVWTISLTKSLIQWFELACLRHSTHDMYPEKPLSFRKTAKHRKCNGDECTAAHWPTELSASVPTRWLLPAMKIWWLWDTDEVCCQGPNLWSTQVSAIAIKLECFFFLVRNFKFEIIFKQFMSSDSFQATFCRSSSRRIHVTISLHKSFSFSSSSCHLTVFKQRSAGHLYDHNFVA